MQNKISSRKLILAMCKCLHGMYLQNRQYPSCYSAQTTKLSTRLMFRHRPFITRSDIQVSRVRRKPPFWFPTWSDTNRAVRPRKMARGLKFRIQKEEGLCYLCSENKGADQLCGHREADLRLWFRICKTFVFS